MSFSLDEFTQIISSIDRLFYMSESETVINISIGYYDTECTQLFRKLSFSLKHGVAEIRIYDHVGIFSYVDINGETLINIKFNDVSRSYQKALTQILAFDRQHSSRQMKSIETLIDRASFGLAEVD